MNGCSPGTMNTRCTAKLEFRGCQRMRETGVSRYIFIGECSGCPECLEAIRTGILVVKVSIENQQEENAVLPEKSSYSA